MRRQTAAEQAAEYLREVLRSGRWSQWPSERALMEELQVSRGTVRAALEILRQEGLLKAAGARRRRALGAPEAARPGPRALRVALLLYEPLADENATMMQLILQLRQGIERAGHEVFFAAKTQAELRHDAARLRRLITTTEADAWIILQGSAELLQGLAAQPLPVLALGGRSRGLPLAGTGYEMVPALTEATRYLLALGHRRVVFLTRAHHRHPRWAVTVEAFAAALAEQGVTAGPYHVPEWEETPEGLQTVLGSLFQVTPPTAFLLMEPSDAVGLLSFLNQRGLAVGRDVSLIVGLLPGPLAWHRPALAHFEGRPELLRRYILRWLRGVARRRPHRAQQLFAYRFLPGESTGPPPR